MPSLMAFFKRKEKAPTEVERLDWKLLERGAVALYHKERCCRRTWHGFVTSGT